MFGLNQLGAVAGSASPGGDAEWNAYFGALRDNVNANWSKAVASYKTLKSVRETLGLPFIVDQGTGEGGSNLVGAWSSDLEQQAVNVHAMVVLITGALDDVIVNKRRVSPYQDGDSWAVERLSGDVLRLETKAPGIPVLVNAQTGQPENVQGTVGAIWIPVALVAAATIVTAGEIYLCVRAVNALESIMKEKTTQTIAKRNAELIASGKATPEQAAALTKAEGAAAADLAKARAEEKNAGDGPEKWSPLVKTVVWGGVAIMGLWIAAKLIPSRSSGGALATNPIKKAQLRTTAGGPLWYVQVREREGSRIVWTTVSKGYETRGKAMPFVVQHAEPLAEALGPKDGRKNVRIVQRRTRQNPMLSSGNWSSPFDKESGPATPPPKKYHLTRVHLNRGGYTKTGRYFGIGKPLYEYESTDGEVHGFLRASDRSEAKKHLRNEQGGARFFNPLSLAAISLV